MDGEKGSRQLVFVCIIFIMSFIPNIVYAADMTIGNTIVTTGDWTVTGIMNATSFIGNGSGLTNLNGANITAGTIGSGALAAGAVGPSSLASGSVTSASLSSGAVTPVNISFYGNVAIVAPSGGAFSDPATAMSNYTSWCGTPSATNPCLLKIMPGVYTVASSVIMQPYIDIEGSGEHVTVITGTQGSVSSPPIGIVNGTDNAELRFLTVRNTGGGGYNAAVVNDTTSPSLLHVTATASGGTHSYGVYNSSSSLTMNYVTATASGATGHNYGVFNGSSTASMMNNIVATASGGSFSHGVLNSSSSPTMSNVTAMASGATNGNSGVLNSSSSPLMSNVTATASGGTNSWGIYSDTLSTPAMSNVTATASAASSGNTGVFNSSAFPTMNNVTAKGSGGTNSYGLYNDGTVGTILIDRSNFEGGTNSIYNNTAYTLNIGASKLVGLINATGTYTCVSSYNGSYGALNSACQ